MFCVCALARVRVRAPVCMCTVIGRVCACVSIYACVRGCVRVQVYVLGVFVCVCTWSVYVCAHVYLSVHVCVDV